MCESSHCTTGTRCWLLDVTHSETLAVFSGVQLIGHLRDYIKLRQLYDPEDPAIVYCGTDPLGHVLGVEKFTLYDAVWVELHDAYSNPV